MNPLETLRIAARALVRNKTRSFLTTLGIIIGVGAVIAMVAIGAGAKAQVEQAFSSMGTNVLILMSGASRSGGARGGFGSQPTLTWDDLEAIRNDISSVRYASPLSRSSAQLLSEDQNWTSSVQGVSPDFFSIRDWKASAGSLFTDVDVEAGAKVVNLGATVAEKLFGGIDPVGQTVRILGTPYVVVGVLEKKGQSANGQDNDDTAVIPVTTFGSKVQGGLGKYINGTIFIGATSPEGTIRAQEDITSLLRQRHNLRPGAEDDFSIRNLSEVANARAEGTQTMTLLLASIAAVSLLVGGIGIMNIMLVSVTERTREIGIRMAIGARSRDILAQFLVEALTLSVTGGLVGVLLGVFAAGQLAESFGWPLLIQSDVILISVGFSALVGVGFGLYPASKASRLDPIEALRYE